MADNKKQRQAGAPKQFAVNPTYQMMALVEPSPVKDASAIPKVLGSALSSLSQEDIDGQNYYDFEVSKVK